MNKNRYLFPMCLLMVTLLLSLIGCSGEQNAETGNQSNTEGSLTEQTTYQDIVFDSAVRDGRMAVYFITSGVQLSTWDSVHSSGQSTLIVMPDDTTVLIDCGAQTEGSYLVDKLQKLGIEKIDYFINTHLHTDHAGGFPILTRYIEIGNVMTPPAQFQVRSDISCRSFWTQVEELGIPYSYIAEGDTFMLGEHLKVQVYNPSADEEDNESINMNEYSLVMKFTYGSSTLLTMADVGNNETDYGRKTETMLVEKYGSELQADIAQVGHHGTDSAKSGMPWRESVNAKVYVTVSDRVRGEDNHYNNIRAGGISLNTGLDGDIVIYTAGDGTYDVQVSQERVTDYYGLLETVDGSLQVE